MLVSLSHDDIVVTGPGIYLYVDTQRHTYILVFIIHTNFFLAARATQFSHCHLYVRELCVTMTNRKKAATTIHEVSKLCIACLIKMANLPQRKPYWPSRARQDQHCEIS